MLPWLHSADLLPRQGYFGVENSIVHDLAHGGTGRQQLIGAVVLDIDEDAVEGRPYFKLVQLQLSVFQGVARVDEGALRLGEFAQGDTPLIEQGLLLLVLTLRRGEGQLLRVHAGLVHQLRVFQHDDEFVLPDLIPHDEGLTGARITLQAVRPRLQTDQVTLTLRLRRSRGRHVLCYGPLRHHLGTNRDGGLDIDLGPLLSATPERREGEDGEWFMQLHRALSSYCRPLTGSSRIKS